MLWWSVEICLYYFGLSKFFGLIDLAYLIFLSKDAHLHANISLNNLLSWSERSVDPT